MSTSFTSSLKFKVFNIVLRLFLGGMLFYGGIEKFKKPIPHPNTVIEQVKAGEEVAPSIEVLKIKNYIFGMKQTNYFWQFLGVMELLAGALLLSQIFGIIGAIIALPLTSNIFLFHLFLESHETGELIMTLLYLLINIWLIAIAYKKWKSIITDRAAIQLQSN